MVKENRMTIFVYKIVRIKKGMWKNVGHTKRYCHRRRRRVKEFTLFGRKEEKTRFGAEQR